MLLVTSGGIVIVQIYFWEFGFNLYTIACFKGIKEGQPRFECLECEDFCQCKACADMKDHPHKMKKFVVPQGCNVFLILK